MRAGLKYLEVCQQLCDLGRKDQNPYSEITGSQGLVPQRSSPKLEEAPLERKGRVKRERERERERDQERQTGVCALWCVRCVGCLFVWSCWEPP